jgi:spore germination protein GerM
MAGCGIPYDAEPTVTPGGVVAPALAPSEPSGRSAPEAEVPVFLIEAEDVVAVVRTAPVEELSAVLPLLLAGPRDAEFAAGIRTAISPQTALRSVRLDGDTATIDLSASFVEVGGQEQILAVAQVVLTSAAVPGVAQVRFLLDGQAVEIPRADGTLTSDPVRAADYEGLVTRR